MRTLFKQIVSFYVNERAFCLAFNPFDKDEAILFTKDYLEQAMLVQYRGEYIVIKWFGTDQDDTFTSLDEFIKYVGSENGGWSGWTNVDNWEIPDFRYV